MEAEIIAIFGIIVGAIILYASEVLPADVTSILVMVVLMLTGLVTPEEGLSGFSNRATLTILALLILSAALENTGAVSLAGENLLKIMPSKEWAVILLLMIVAAFSSAFIATTAVVAVFIPIVIKISRTTGINAAKLLMPLSFAAIAGGSSTVIGTSTNLIVNSLAQQHGLGGFGIFEITWIGLIFFSALLIYMILIGRHLIPNRRGDAFADTYKLKDYLTEVILKPESTLVGRTAAANVFGKSSSLELIEVRRNGMIFFPEEVKDLKAEDRLIIKGRVKDIADFKNQRGVKVISDFDAELWDVQDEDIVQMEVIVGPNSRLQNKYFDPEKFRRKFQAIPLAIRTSGRLRRTLLTDVKLRFGDAFLIETRKSNLPLIYESNDLVVLQEHDSLVYRHDKLGISVITTAAVVLLAALEIFPIVIAAWAGVLTLIITNCISMQRAYERVEWRVIFLLGGIIPLGLAMEKHGAGDFLANQIVSLLGDSSMFLLCGMIFVMTTLLTSIMSNNAAAILLVPIALSIGYSLDIDPKPLLIVIMFGANASFFTPIGYQTNTMIYGIGNYRFTDFTRVGGIYTIIIVILATLLIPWYYFS